MIEILIAVLAFLPAATAGYIIGWRRGVRVISDAVRAEIQTITTK